MAAGTGMDRVKALAAQERDRVRAILRRDRAESEREDRRSIASTQVKNGSFSNINDTVVEPTEEWLSKGDVQSLTVESLNGTSRSVRTVKRITGPIVTKLWFDGKMELREASACLRYRNDYEASSLVGRYSSSSFGLTPDVRVQMVSGDAMVSEKRMLANDLVHSATKCIPDPMRAFFKAVTLDDIPLRRASRLVRCRNGHELTLFVSISAVLANHYEDIGVELVQGVLESGG